jgi:glycosyltransferase involved in cell wall biosynthesis
MPELALVLAGSDGASVVDIESAIASLPAGALVVRTGWVDPGGRADLLGHALALAYPSFDEGFGLPVLEAMAQGIPVVAASIPALRETAGDAALFVDPLDTDALAEALLNACRDAALRSELLQRGSRNVTRFSWRETANGLVALYREAMAEGRRA